MNQSTEQSVFRESSCYSNRSVVPDLLTEDELIEFLRIPQVSTSKNYHNVVQNLIRFRKLPRIQIGKRLLFPKLAVLEWIKKETITE